MTSAIVNITCPHCGGNVRGVEAGPVAQTLPCSYCGTELHVPAVGAAVVRETIIREVIEPAVSSYEPDINVRPRPMWPRIVALAVGAVAILILIVSNQHEADEITQRYDRERRDREQCQADCAASCAAPAPLPPALEGLQTTDPDLVRGYREADRVACESKCELDRDCWHLEH